MKFLRNLAIILCFLSTPLLAQEPIKKVRNPVELQQEVYLAKTAIPKEIEGLQWNRWTSKNFVVLAINDRYAEYLNTHLELVKTWTLGRWGLFDVDFSVPCKMICVDDPVLYEKLFKLKQSKVEVRRDEQGRIKETVIFLLANTAPSHAVPSPLAEACLAEFGQKHNTNFGFWLYRGTSLLNGSLEQIRGRVVGMRQPLTANQPIYFSKGLLEMKREDYLKLSDDQKQLYDSCAMVFCLMIRKEYGQDKFHHLMKDSSVNPEAALKAHTKFDSYDLFDRTFKRYMIDLANGINSGKTPDHYLQIYEAETEKD